MKNDNKFAAINRPKDIRINNLNAAKETVNAVKIFFRIKNIRERKLELMGYLDKEVKGLQLLFAKLYEILPEHDMLESRKTKDIPIRKTKDKSLGHSTKLNKKKGTKKKATGKTASDKQIDKLEQSLSLIEKRLKKL